MKKIPIDPRIDKYLGVSQLVCDSWKELTGIDTINVYEPVVLNNCGKSLMFCSATRLTKEKGWNRMKKLADILDENNVNYTWLIFTNNSKLKPTKNMIFCKPTLDITNKLNAFDAFIQLSDNEGFCLSVVEALMRGVPIIGTNIPVFKELGLNENNSIILDMNLDNIPIEKIKNIYKLNFTYEPPVDKWGEILINEPNTYKGEKIYKVRALNSYKDFNIKDSVLGKVIEPGEVFEVMGEERLKLLLGNNKRKIPFIELIDS